MSYVSLFFFCDPFSDAVPNILGSLCCDSGELCCGDTVMVECTKSNWNLWCFRLSRFENPNLFWQNLFVLVLGLLDVF